MTSPRSIVDVRRAQDRAKTEISWLDSKHSFSFGGHYDPDNTHHGLLLVNNDDNVSPGTGFDAPGDCGDGERGARRRVEEARGGGGAGVGGRKLDFFNEQ